MKYLILLIEMLKYHTNIKVKLKSGFVLSIIVVKKLILIYTY